MVTTPRDFGSFRMPSKNFFIRVHELLCMFTSIIKSKQSKTFVFLGKISSKLRLSWMFEKFIFFLILPEVRLNYSLRHFQEFKCEETVLHTSQRNLISYHYCSRIRSKTSQTRTKFIIS